MTNNEIKIVKSALKPFLDNGLLSESAMQEIFEPRPADGHAVRPDLLTRNEACKVLGLCGQSLINYEKQKILPSIRIAGKRAVRYRFEDIQNLLDSKIVENGGAVTA